MLKITVPARNLWNEELQEFIDTKECTLTLEHSLISMSKWESKWLKPFLSKEPKTYEETIDYIRCMTLNQNVDPAVYYCLTDDLINKINEYIEAPMSATTINNRQGMLSSREIVTSELVYYWMIAMEIPFECEKWHLNRLMKLIQICSIKNQPSKKMSRKATLQQNAALNAARRSRLGTKG